MAEKVGEPQYKGPGDGQIQENATSPALQAVEQGKSPTRAGSRRSTPPRRSSADGRTGHHGDGAGTTQGGARPAPRRPRLTWRQRLSVADVKWSPYLYVAPFFVIFGVVGLFPLLYTSYLSLFDRELLDVESTFIGFDNYADAARRRAVLERAGQHDQHLRAVHRPADRHRGAAGGAAELPAAAADRVAGRACCCRTWSASSRSASSSPTCSGPTTAWSTACWSCSGWTGSTGRPTGSPRTSRSRSW